jgi:hypothetical protein
MTLNVPPGLMAHEGAMDAYDEQARGLVGAQIGNWLVKARAKPAKRWVYVAFNRKTGQTKGLRGFEVVRLARQARSTGLPVVMPREPWRDE